MGLIIATSSVTGALFDIAVCRIFKNVSFRRMFLLMFAVCLLFPLVLFSAKTAIIYILAMAMWGIYYDLKNFGSFDFVSRFTSHDEHSSSFGVISIAISIAYVVAPLFASYLIEDRISWEPFIFAWIALSIAFIFYLILICNSKSKKPLSHTCPECEEAPSPSKKSEMKIWASVGKIIFPILLLTVMLNIIDSFFWTVGPLLAEELMSTGNFLARLVVPAYMISTLLIGWTIGSITNRFGKKRSAFIGLLIGSGFYFLIYFIHEPALIVLDIFVASLLASIAWPAINGAYADYISETAQYEKEIAGLEDFYTNIGFVIGPVIAGLLADTLGNAGAFSIMGLIGMILAIILLCITPKSININKSLTKQI